MLCMRKFILFTFLIVLSGASIAQQLSFRFANPRIIRLSNVDHLQFDVQVKCNAANTYLWAATVKLNFNISAFSNTASQWVVATQGGFNGFNSSGSSLKYTVTKTIVGSVYNIALTGDVGVAGNGPNGDDFGAVPQNAWTTLITVSARLQDFSGDALAGITFQESGMNGFQQYITGPSTFSTYVNPNLYDSRNFVSDFTGRFYSDLYGWSQLGGSTNNAQFVDWTASLNTSVWDGVANIPNDGSESLAKNIRIDDPATLTVPVNGKLTVSGSTTILTASGLAIQSAASGTGSLITGSATGSGTAGSYVTTGSWHQVSPSLSGQAVSDFLTSTGNVTNVATKNGTDRGMMNYITSNNTWSSFYTNSSGGTLAAGQGYMMRTDFDAAVNFTGTITSGSVAVTLSGSGNTGWNLIGNPYTSAIDLNSHTPSDFLSGNPSGSVLDASYMGVYIWNQGAGKYDVINYGTSPEDAAVGQAFFVKSASDGAEVNFTPAMQLHMNSVNLKSVNSYPEIKLDALLNGKNTSTSIKFISGATNGLDPGYDAGIFSLDSPVSIYTRLVEDNGTNFMLQCLPANDFSGLIIPVGIDSKSGGEITFSAEATNLSPNRMVILEDKQSKTFTNLLNDTYKTTIEATTNDVSRFQLHTYDITTGLEGENSENSLNAYAVGNTQIRLTGNVGTGSKATLYDIQGRAILIKNLEKGNLNILSTPVLRTGIYLLMVEDNGRSQRFKIPVKK